MQFGTVIKGAALCALAGFVSMPAAAEDGVTALQSCLADPDYWGSSLADGDCGYTAYRACWRSGSNGPDLACVAKLFASMEAESSELLTRLPAAEAGVDGMPQPVYARLLGEAQPAAASAPGCDARLGPEVCLYLGAEARWVTTRVLARQAKLLERQP